MNEPIRILMIDPQKMFREGLKLILQKHGKYELVPFASTAEEGLRLFKEFRPSIVLSEVDIPAIEEEELLLLLKRIDPNSKTILLTARQDRDALLKAIHLNLDGFVLKSSDSSILIGAIKAVLEGNTFIEPSMLKEIVMDMESGVYLHKKNSENSKRLTLREHEILKHIAEGYLNKDIAKVLFISEKTVKNHISNIFRKINVNDRTQAAIYAFKNGIAHY